MRRRVIAIATLAALVVVTTSACRARQGGPTGHATAGQQSAAQSAYPVAVDPSRVGTYPALTKSGAGYFYDEVLEYRVWVHPPEGGDDTYQAFATHEEAVRYSQVTSGAEEPLVLVRQREWVDEPTPGEYIHERSERITEWRVEWLAGSQRQPDSIAQFLKGRRRGPTRS